MGFGMFDSDRYDENGNYNEDYHRSTATTMFGTKMGTWAIRSNTDSRWNNSGRSTGLVVYDGPTEMKDWIKSCKEKYGKPPEDLTWSFIKD